MTHQIIDYTNSPAKHFDAVEDIKSFLGRDRWERIYPLMAKVTNRDTFEEYANLAGIGGFNVEAWYDHYHGQGAWFR